MTPATFTPVELPWHQRLEARVASALGLLVAVALGAVLPVTLSVVSAQSRERVAADLEVAISDERQLLLEAHSAAAQFFQTMLATHPQGAAAREYLAGRGFDAPTLAKFGVGLAPDGWSNRARWTM